MPRPARRPSTARYPRPARGRRSNDPRDSGPSPCCKWLREPGRSTGRAAVAGRTHPAEPCGAFRRCRRLQTAACRLRGRRASRRANIRRSTPPAGRDRPWPARGSCRRACPGRCRAASRRCRWQTRARASARRRRARLDPTQRLGQAPVHHQCLAVLADDHVARLDVAVQHAAQCA